MRYLIRKLAPAALALLGLTHCAPEHEQDTDPFTGTPGPGQMHVDAGAQDAASPPVDLTPDASAPVTPVDAGSDNAPDTGAPDTGIPDTDPLDSGAPVDEGPQTGPFPPVSDLSAVGPYKSRTINRTGPNGNYTLYAPEQLAPDGAKNPIVTWGNGGATTPSWYSLLPHLATHGFVVIASNTTPLPGSEMTLGQEMKAGVDWLIAENGRSGSDFHDKLDTTKIAAMGYSMGSLATFTIVGDPRLTTTLHISGGNMGNGAERVKALHAPAAFLCGENDIAYPNCNTDWEALTTQEVFYGVFKGGDHLGVLFDPHAARIRAASTGWLRWMLMGDRTLKAMFVGSDCGLCKDPNWVVQQKNLN